MDAKEGLQKFNFMELLKDYRFSNQEILTLYFKDIYKDLSFRSDDSSLGVSKETFVSVSYVIYEKYYELPGIIAERLFNVLDKDSNRFLNTSEFADGLCTLFTGVYDSLINLIFDIYDFNKDNKISCEDILVILSYIPLEKRNEYKSTNFKYEKDEFDSQIISKRELDDIVRRIFKSDMYIDKEKFMQITEEVSSEAFLYVII